MSVCTLQSPDKTEEVTEVYVKLCDEIYLYGLSEEQYADIRTTPETLKTYWRCGCPFSEPARGVGRVKLLRKRKRKITKYDLLNRNIFISREEQILVSAQTDFFTGIKYNNVKLILSSIANGAEPRACSKEIPFPLHYLARQGYVEAMRILLCNGVPANTVDRNGKTPLYLSSSHGHIDACKLLLQNGACYRHSKCENSPLQACKSNSYLIKLFKRISRAFRLARRGDRRLMWMIRSLCSTDMSLVHTLTNPVDARGRTIMAVALRHGHAEFAECILTYRLVVADCV